MDATKDVCPGSCAGNRVEVSVAGRVWTLDRAGDLEALWQAMDDLDEDERLPYWAEVWPASVMVSEWIAENADSLRGKACLDIGCGLGLTALVAAEVGARVVAFDYEYPAVAYARHNASENGVPQPLWVQMDWRLPAVPAGAFDYLWAGDVLYEKRFFDPLIKLFRHALAPGGAIIIGEPVRTVSRDVWQEIRNEGFTPEKLETRKVALCGQNATVNLWKITL